MDTYRIAVLMLSVISLLLLTSGVNSQRSGGSSSMGRLSRLTAGQQDVFSLANSQRGVGSRSNGLLADIVGYNRGGRSQFPSPDASYLRGSMNSRNLVVRHGDLGSRYHATGLNGMGRISSSLSRYGLRNNMPMMSAPSMLTQQGFNMPQGASSNIIGGVMQQQFAQQPTNTFVGVAPQRLAMPYANIPTANVLSTIVQPAPNLMPIVQSGSVMVQQSPHMVPLVGVATQPMQTVLSHAPTVSFGDLRGLRGLGGGLGRSLFSKMEPLIVKMEDAPSFHRSSHAIHSSHPMGRGKGRSEGNPNISVLKLDEGLSVVVNYSDPYGTIMNLPVPTNEEEATLLKRVLEQAEAPEYLKTMIRIRPRPAPAVFNPAINPASGNGMGLVQPAPATLPVAGAANVAGAATNVAAANAVNAANAAAAAAAAAAASGSIAAPMAIASPVVNAAGMGTFQGNQLMSAGSFAAYEDQSIDEIIANTIIPITGVTAGATVGGANNHPIDSRFRLTALDMELTQQQYAELHSPTLTVGGRKKRKALSGTRTRWTGGVIPFEIQGVGFSPADHQQILNAMSQWSRSTCITFRQATAADANKLVFREGQGCSSNVGMIGGSQFLTLQKECRIPKILAHEVGHALGLIHEHQRDDRDNFIRVNYQNMKPGTEKDFDLFKVGSIDNSIAGYDYMSIMHYGKSAFARDKTLVTMEALDPKFTNLMGTAKTLSPSDYNTVNVMYGCTGRGGMAQGGAMASQAFPGSPAIPVAPAVAPMHHLMSAVPANTMVAGSHVQQTIAAHIPMGW